MIIYAGIQKEFDFTCTEIISKLNLIITPKQFGRLLKANINLLKNEGLYITEKRTGQARLYHAKYEETIDEND